MASASNIRERFELANRVAVITGGAGLLGTKHAEAIAEMGGTPILVDIDEKQARLRARELSARYACDVDAFQANICNVEEVSQVLSRVLDKFGRVDILINNAANNP